MTQRKRQKTGVFCLLPFAAIKLETTFEIRGGEITKLPFL
jgi:hypothetical protein